MEKIGRCDKCNKLVFNQKSWGHDNSSGKHCADCGKTLCANCYGVEEMQDQDFNCCKDCKKETLEVLQEPEKMSFTAAMNTIDMIKQYNVEELFNE